VLRVCPPHLHGPPAHVTDIVHAVGQLRALRHGPLRLGCAEVSALQCRLVVLPGLQGKCMCQPLVSEGTVAALQTARLRRSTLMITLLHRSYTKRVLREVDV
jgi:hypothetical protein